MNTDFIISEPLKRVSFLEKGFVQLKKENTRLKDENVKLRYRILELESRVNSKNSSRPPSSDGYNKRPAFPKKTKGKKGGQKGHKGSTLQQVVHPDEVVRCLPEKCSCGHEFSLSKLILSEKRQVFDLPQPKLIVTEYQVHQATCPVCGEINPENVKAPVQYGNGVKAYITMLDVHYNRGKLALKSDKSILDRINGWFVHDSWSSYFSFNNYKHAMCGAHILRGLQGLIESGQSKWAKTFKLFLMSVYDMPFTERMKRKQQIEARFRLICNLGNKIEPPLRKTPGKRGRYKQTKGRNLLERLIKYQSAVLAFAFNEQIPFTNNLAERNIRPTKIKQKMSNSFRSFKGAESYCPNRRVYINCQKK